MSTTFYIRTPDALSRRYVPVSSLPTKFKAIPLNDVAFRAKRVEDISQYALEAEAQRLWLEDLDPTKQAFSTFTCYCHLQNGDLLEKFLDWLSDQKYHVLCEDEIGE